MTETLVTHSIPPLVDFLAKCGGEMIVKPLDGRGGEGIFHVRHDDRNLFSILEQATRFGRRRTMAQRYLPEVRRGDKRILLLDGEPIGALLRVPAEGEMRANLHVGGRAVRTQLDEDDRRIVERLAPALRRDGLFFVGIDVIGGRLTEVNVTSPTGVQEVNALEDTQLEAASSTPSRRLVGGLAQRAVASESEADRNSIDHDTAMCGRSCRRCNGPSSPPRLVGALPPLDLRSRRPPSLGGTKQTQNEGDGRWPRSSQGPESVGRRAGSTSSTSKAT